MYNVVVEAIFVIFVIVGVWFVILSWYMQWFDHKAMLEYLRTQHMIDHYNAWKVRPWPKRLRGNPRRWAATRKRP